MSCRRCGSQLPLRDWRGLSVCEACEAWLKDWAADAELTIRMMVAGYDAAKAPKEAKASS